MFYAQFILSRKGPLARIWLAAHWEKKLTKANILDTNIDEAIEQIEKPRVKLSLRTTGHLLLGIVRIYARKAKYLLADCNDTLAQIRFVFKPDSKGARQLRPKDGAEKGNATDARLSEIPIPEEIGIFYENIPELAELHMDNPAAIGEIPTCQSRIEDITLRDENNHRFDPFGNRILAFDPNEGGIDDFGEGEPEKRAASRAQSLMLGELDWSDAPIERRRHDNGSLLQLDKFGDSSLVTLFADRDVSEVFTGARKGPAGAGVNGIHPAEELDLLLAGIDGNRDLTMEVEVPRAPGTMFEEEAMEVDGQRQQQGPVDEHLTESQGSFGSFELEPLDQAAIDRERNARREVRTRPRRNHGKVLYDEQTQLTGDEIKANMNDYSDIMTQIAVAPPTKELMYIYENNTLEKLMTIPACHEFLRDPWILNVYQNNLILCSADEINTDEMAIQIRDELEMTDNLWETVEFPRQNDVAPGADEQMPIVDNSVFLDGAENRTVIEQQDPTMQHFAENRMEIEPDENLDPLLRPITGEDNQFELTLPDADAEISPPAAKKSRQNESAEQEDKTTDGTVFTRRAKNVLATIVSRLEQSESNKIKFEDILPRVRTRNTVAQKFYALLELKKWEAIDLEQEAVSTEAPALYGTIWIGEGGKMHETLQLPTGAVTPAQ